MREDNWVIRIGRRFTIASIALSGFILLLRFPALPPLVPLWYSKPWGTDRLADPLWMTILPAASLVILCVNTAASRILAHDMLIFRQILAATMLLVAILSTVALARIVFLVS